MSSNHHDRLLNFFRVKPKGAKIGLRRSNLDRATRRLSVERLLERTPMAVDVPLTEAATIDAGDRAGDFSVAASAAIIALAGDMRYELALIEQPDGPSAFSGPSGPSGSSGSHCASDASEGGPLPAVAGPSEFFSLPSGPKLSAPPPRTTINQVVLGTTNGGNTPLIPDGSGDDSHVGYLLVNSASFYYHYVRTGNVRNNTPNTQNVTYTDSETNSHSLMNGNTINSSIKTGLETSIGVENEASIGSVVETEIGESSTIEDTWVKTVTNSQQTAVNVMPCQVVSLYDQFEVMELSITYGYYEDTYTSSNGTGFTYHTDTIIVTSERMVGSDYESKEVDVVYDGGSSKPAPDVVPQMTSNDPLQQRNVAVEDNTLNLPSGPLPHAAGYSVALVDFNPATALLVHQFESGMNANDLEDGRGPFEEGLMTQLSAYLLPIHLGTDI